MMIRVALTGNIGAGKSTVCRIFELLGVPVYHADAEAKKFLADSAIVGILVKQFNDVILTDSKIDRQKLAAVVFRDREALEFLNSVIHPLVREDLRKWIARNANVPYIIQEAAILFESGFDSEFDKIILVVSPHDLVLKRLRDRDGLSEKEIENRLIHQWDQDKKKGLSDFVIYNDEKHLVIPQVLEIHKKLMA
jgi:dephospho-CoA kinase